MNFFKRTQPNVQHTSGIYLGTINDRRKTVDLRFDSEGSGSIVSPPGGGKTAKCFCPTLLTDPATHIVFDPTLEIYSMTHVARELLGNDVYVACPHPDDANEILHPDHQITDCGINFFGSSEFKGKPESVRENIKNRVELLLPDNVKTDAKTRFFEIDGRDLLEFTCLDERNRGRDITLPNTRERILSGPAELNEAFVEAMDSSAFAGELALLANGLNGVLTASPQQFSGGYGCAKQAVGLYDNYSSVGRHVSGPGFDPALLKTGEKNVTLYINYPGERIKTHQRMAAATMTYLFQQICKGKPGKRVNVLIDEAAELGYFPIARFMNIGRKFNLRIFAAWQELEGQVDEVFGRSGVRQILSASELMWITSLRGPETCETFSKMIGMKGIENLSLNDRPQSTSTMPDQSFGRGHQSVPLIRPEDLQRMDQRLALVLVGANKPMLVNKVGYFEREAFSRIAGPNPYRG